MLFAITNEDVIRQDRRESDFERSSCFGFKCDGILQWLLQKSFTACVIEIDVILFSSPDGPQAYTARASQQELQTAPDSQSSQRDRLQFKLFSNQVFLAAKSFMDIGSKVVHGPDGA